MWLTNRACDFLGGLFHGRVDFSMNRQKDCKNRAEIRVLIVKWQKFVFPECTSYRYYVLQLLKNEFTFLYLH